MIKHYKNLNSFQIKELLKLWEQSVRASHHFLDEKSFINIKNYLSKMDFKEFEFLFAYENDEFVGFLGFDKESIQMLFISPRFFHQGFGKKLLTKALNDFKLFKVEVNLDNENALKFYQKFGFEKVGEYKDNFGFTLLKMQKP